MKISVMKTSILKVIIILTFIVFISNSFAQQRRFSFGLMVSDVDINYAKFLGFENNEGVYVIDVLKDSPADRAGIKQGDVITEVNGLKIKGVREFHDYFKSINPERELILYVVKGKDKKEKLILKPVEITTLPQVEVTKKQSFDFNDAVVKVDEESFIREVIESKMPVLAYFYADWCSPCRKLLPVINDVAKQSSDFLKVVAVDVVKNKKLAETYGIGGIIPSVILFSNGNEFDKIIRLSSKDQIENLLSKYKTYTEKRIEIFAEVGKESSISSVAWIDNSRFFVSLRKNKVSVWDFEKGALDRVYYSPVISLNGRFLALVDEDRNSFKLVDLLNNQVVEIKTDQFIEEIGISSNGKYAATYGKDKTSVYSVKLWNLETKGIIKRISVDGKVGLNFSPDSSFLVLNGYGKSSIFDTKTWEEAFNFIHHDESFREILFSPDGRYLHAKGKNFYILDLKEKREYKIDFSIIGFSRNSAHVFVWGKDNSFELIDFRTKKTLVTFPNYLALVDSVATSSDNKFVLSGSVDGSVRLWDVKTGDEIAQFIDYANNEWLVITKEGYYSSSIKGHKNVKVRKGKNIYTIEQFYDVFYRPDIVMTKLRGENISDLITLTIDEAINNPPPSVEITSLPKETNQSKIKVCFKVKSTGGGIGEVRLFHNGKLVYSDGFYRDTAKAGSYKKLSALSGKRIYDEMRGIKITTKGEVAIIQSKSKGEVFEDCQEIDVSLGENEISVTAFNKQNTVQSFMQTASFNAKIETQKPKLYILAIGIDKYKDPSINLKYAVKDAKDIVEKIVKQSATVYEPENIHYEILTDSNATKINILESIAKISKIIKPIDGFIIFVAGHGVLLENQYYMLIHDFSGEINLESLISSNEIVEISKRIKSLNQLFIFDTCHAGGVDYIISGLYDARMSVLAKKLGLHVYASASTFQEAIDGYKGNGLFTYSLLEGLNNNRDADRNKDSKVSLIELGEYSKLKTVEISKSIGHTQTPLIINFGKDIVLYELKW